MLRADEKRRNRERYTHIYVIYISIYIYVHISCIECDPGASHSTFLHLLTIP